MTTVTDETSAQPTREQLLAAADGAASNAADVADGQTIALVDALEAIRCTLLAAVQPPEPRADKPPEIQAGFYHAELMGHRERWGHLRPVTFAGRPLVEIRTPAYEREGANEPETVAELVEYYSPAAIFSLSPLTEAEVLDELKERASYPF